MLFVNMSALTGVFSGVVLVHEAGHYLAARRCGVHVAEFSIGFPGTPVLVTYLRYQETAFTLRLLPFGGFVRFGAVGSLVATEGDDAAPTGEIINNDGGFQSLPPYNKAAVLVAGSLCNLVVGALLMLAAIMTIKGLGALDAATAVLGLMGMIAGETFSTLVHLDLSGIVGPVGMAGIVHQAMSKGIWPLVGIAGLMSVSVGVTNLLPIPGFDGWHIALTGVEAVRRQRLSWRFHALATVAGYAGIMALIVAITYHDSLRLLRGAW